MKPLLAIDQGASGGIAWQSANGNTQCIPMPQGMSAQIDELRGIVAANPGIQAVIERVGTYVPGNSGVAAATFARHCGHIEAALYCFGVPTTQVAPHKWQAALGAWPKDKKQRKRAIKEAMARRFPALNVTLKTSDALGILCYARQQATKED